jgi:hypothetical protein
VSKRLKAVYGSRSISSNSAKFTDIRRVLSLASRLVAQPRCGCGSSSG